MTHGSHYITISNISSEATRTIVIKFNEELSGAEWKKYRENGPGHMTNMVAVPVDEKKTLKIFSGTNGPIALNFDMWDRVPEHCQDCSNNDLFK